MITITPFLAYLVVFLPATLTPQEQASSDGNWPSFRGAFAQGVAEGYGLPERWDVDEDKNILWRTPLPGLAHSSPVVWGDKLFVTTAVRLAGEAELSSLYGSDGYGAGESVAEEGPHSFRLVCLDRKSGEILWQQEALAGTPEVKRHPKSTHANSTPAVDAKRVVAFFGSEGIFGYDHMGELLWSLDFGVLDAGAPDLDGTRTDTDALQWGFASSPILYADKVIVQCDVQGQSFLVALDAATGEEVWRTNRDENPTWSSPTILPLEDGKAQVLTNGFKHIGAYDLESGKEIWRTAGGGDVPVPTPVVAHGMAYFTSAHGRLAPLYAVTSEAEGTLTPGEEDSAIQWYHRRRGIYMQTPLIYGYELYACSDGGVLACYDALTGEEIYRERLGDGRSGFSASAVAGDGKLYFTDEEGTVHVVQAGRDFHILARNLLDETCLATPALSHGNLFFRTTSHVVAVGE